MLLTAPVECGKYFKADRGTLTLADGQLRFDTGGRCVFDVPVSSIEKIVWHWYSFSGAFEATISGQAYFLSFVPRGAGFNDWYTGLATGSRWRAALEGKAAPDRAPIGARLFRVFFRIAQIFLLGCTALLMLGIAIDPASSTFDRIGGGVGAIASGLGAAILIGQGMLAILASTRHR